MLSRRQFLLLVSNGQLKRSNSWPCSQTLFSVVFSYISLFQTCSSTTFNTLADHQLLLCSLGKHKPTPLGTSSTATQKKWRPFYLLSLSEKTYSKVNTHSCGFIWQTRRLKLAQCTQAAVSWASFLPGCSSGALHKAHPAYLKGIPSLSGYMLFQKHNE